jgi:preprotein translocase subunit SecG
MKMTSILVISFVVFALFLVANWMNRPSKKKD